MKKTASVLAFLLGIGMIIACLVMTRDDGKNAADNMDRGFQAALAGDNATVAAQAHEMEERRNDERTYGIGGVIALIAGFALWPRTSPKAIQDIPTASV